MSTIKVGLVGLGFMGQMHFGCYQNNLHAEIVAVCDENISRFESYSAVAGNIEGTAPLDFSGLHVTSSFEEMLSHPDIQVLDLCLPTPFHASASIAALRAGKHVLCEKPMAMTTQECDAMLQAAKENDRLLMIGHCLRFWPQYVAAHQILQRGDLGRIVYVRFHRSTAAPTWSQWMLDGTRSGGAVLDTHIHDIDTALWWFGQPDSVSASGIEHNGLNLKVDALWKYNDGPQVYLHCGWDLNGGSFRMSFEVMGEDGTLSWDSTHGETLQLHKNNATREIEVPNGMGYAPEIDYFLECVAQSRKPERASPQSSRLAIELALQEVSQLKS